MGATGKPAGGSALRARRLIRTVFCRACSRARAQERESLVDGLMWMFRPLFPAMTLVALIIAFNNWSDHDDTYGDTSILEAVFAIEPISLNAAYAMEE